MLVLAVLAGVAAWRLDLADRWFADDPPSPITEPARVPPPAGLTLPAARLAAPVAEPAAGRAVDGAAVRRAVEPLLRMRKLGQARRGVRRPRVRRTRSSTGTAAAG